MIAPVPVHLFSITFTGPEANIGKQTLALLYLPLDLSTLVDRLAGRQVNKYGLPIITFSPIFVLDLSTLVDRLKGQQVDNKQVDRI